MDSRVVPSWDVGDRVIALVQVLEQGVGDVYDPAALPCAKGWAHAEPGELGWVVHVEPGCFPTVRWDRTGTATCVTSYEAKKAED